MTKTTVKVRRKLSREILGLLAITLLISLFLFQILIMAGCAMIDHVLFMRDIVLTEAQHIQVNDWIFHLSLLVSVGFQFVISKAYKDKNALLTQAANT